MITIVHWLISLGCDQSSGNSLRCGHRQLGVFVNESAHDFMFNVIPFPFSFSILLFTSISPLVFGIISITICSFRCCISILSLDPLCWNIRMHLSSISYQRHSYFSLSTNIFSSIWTSKQKWTYQTKRKQKLIEFLVMCQRIINNQSKTKHPLDIHLQPLRVSRFELC